MSTPPALRPIPRSPLLATPDGRPTPAGRLLRLVQDSPSAPALLLAVAVFIVWAQDETGQALDSWLPGSVLLAALTLVVAIAAPPRLRKLPTPTLVAGGALTAYTLWSFLSITWAADKGMAWEGSDRTLLYLIVFVLFAFWRLRPVAAATVLGAMVIGWVLMALATTGRLSESDAVAALFLDGRLIEPAGYVNAAACLWAMIIPAGISLASAKQVHWAIRGISAGGVVLAADLALLAQSRGSLFATPIVLVLWFALLPDRTRRFAVFAGVALGVAISAPSVLHAGDLVYDGQNPRLALESASQTMLLAASLVAIAVAAIAAFETVRRLKPQTERQVQRIVSGAGIATAAVIVLAGLVAVHGNPVGKLDDAWSSFKGGYSSDTSKSRLITGLGSNRYDFYRVALDSFKAHPIIGIGADNYRTEYLVRGKSDETPTYPHSVELRALQATGLIGALMLATFFGAAFFGAWRAARAPDPLARAVVIGAVGMGFYWFVHGSADWFWEIAGLGAPAIAMLGLANSTDGAAVAERRRPPSRRYRQIAGGVAALIAIVAAIALVPPWVRVNQVDDAAKIWTKSPGKAFAELDDAAGTDPLSASPYLVKGAIAVRLNQLHRADTAFGKAHERNPKDYYALLEQGAIAATLGDRTRAEQLLAESQALSPRDPYVNDALTKLRAGKRVDVNRLNLALARRGARLAGHGTK